MTAERRPTKPSRSAAGNLRAPAPAPGVRGKGAKRASRLFVDASQSRLADLRKPAPPEIQAPPVGLPIWFAALIATHCHAKANGQGRAIRWNCVSGRAVYTNQGVEVEEIEPLGIHLQGGQTVVVWWTPGETAYTVEVIRRLDCVA